MMAATLSPLSCRAAYIKRLVASSTTAMRVNHCSGCRASQWWRLPSRCKSSPKHGRGSRRGGGPPPGAGLAAAAMPAAGLVFGHEPGRRQGLFHEGIAEAHAVLTPGELVKMPDIEPQIPLAIEREQPLHLGDRRTLGRRDLTPTIQQPVIAVVLQPAAQSPDRAWTV